MRPAKIAVRGRTLASQEQLAVQFAKQENTHLLQPPRRPTLALTVLPVATALLLEQHHRTLAKSVKLEKRRRHMELRIHQNVLLMNMLYLP